MGTTLTPFNQGQLAKLGNDFNIAIATALPNVAAKFEPKSLLKALEGKGQFLADKLEPVLEQILNGLFVLGTPGTTSVTLTKSHDPVAFYQTRKGLYVYDDFRTRIAAKAAPMPEGAAFKLEHSIFTKNMFDREIEASLPKNHLFDESTVCAVIAVMIEEQPDGKEGKLLNNGYANLFYTSSYVVNVYWNAVSREWGVGTWMRDDGWGAGDQVFSLATAA